MRRLFLIFSFVAFFGFAPKKPVEVPPVVEPVPSISMKARWNNPDWTSFLAHELRNAGMDSLTPKDITNFCGNYKGNEIAFWVYLISAMSELESGHKPNTTYRESFKNSKGEYVISTGLLQLSTESGRGYGCDVSDLKDPYLNLKCGVKILKKWVQNDQVIATNGAPWRGGSRYWSVLRPQKLFKIQGWTKEFCTNVTK